MSAVVLCLVALVAVAVTDTWWGLVAGITFTVAVFVLLERWGKQ